MSSMWSATFCVDGTGVAKPPLNSGKSTAPSVRSVLVIFILYSNLAWQLLVDELRRLARWFENLEVT